MKKAIIVGASSGIGEELAKILAQNDYKIGITGRRTELLDKLKKTNSNSFIVKTFDATDTRISIEKLHELVSKLGTLDLLILSSGVGTLNDALNFDVEKKVIDLNVTGFTNIIDWGFNYFKTQGFGHIVAITSIAGIRGGRQAPSYNATKSYQINYLEGLRQKVKKIKIPIYITDIRPGLVDTNMAQGEGLFWVMPVEKAAKQIFKGIKRKRKVLYVTKRWGYIARILKILPRFIYDRM